MCYHNYKLNLQSQIIEIEKLLALADGNPFIEFSLKERIENLKEKLNNLKDFTEPRLTLLFSGDAVVGSIGISSTFVSKTIQPIQGLIKLKTIVDRYGSKKKRGIAKNLSQLYLTSLEKGSFGYELSLLNPTDLFENQEVGNSIQSIMDIIHDVTDSDEKFNRAIQSLPPRGLVFLNSFFKELSETNSILKLESGSKYIELSTSQIQNGFSRVSSTIYEEKEIQIKALFMGILIETGKFEIVDSLGHTINGDISPNLSQEDLANYNREFSKEECNVKLMKITTLYNNGTQKENYELIEINS